jgi:hypothetical protein
MRSRLDEYAHLLEAVLEAGYEVVGIERFWRDETQSLVDAPGPRLVLRHDVDTDPATAAAMWRIERDLGIAGSWFFRLSTRDDMLMSAIAAAGGEVGYHYEELATIAKARRLRTRDEALAALPAAREQFRANLEAMRDGTGLPMRVAASHGDFVNRLLEVPNWEMLQDPAFRREVGIDLEGYDDELLGRMPFRTSDTAPPKRWRDEDPTLLVSRNLPVVYVLVHPRHWRVARRVNAMDDIHRAWEGAAYRMPRRRPRRAG